MKYKHTEVLQVTSAIIRQFNRDTGWVATGVLGCVIFAALLLAVQEHHPSTGKADQAGNDLFLNAYPSTIGSAIAKSFNGKMAPEPEDSVDDAFAGNSAKGTSVVPFPDEMNGQDALPDTSSRPPQILQNSIRGLRPKVRKAKERSSSLLVTTDVKRRLVALWHQSLAQSERPRGWTAFSRLSGGMRKRAAYTAETNRRSAQD